MENKPLRGQTSNLLFIDDYDFSWQRPAVVAAVDEITKKEDALFLKGLARKKIADSWYQNGIALDRARIRRKAKRKTQKTARKISKRNRK
jgi:hypothetical protein